MNKLILSKIFFFVVILLCFFPWFNSAYALLCGVFLAFIWGNPYLDWTKAHTHRVLSWSIIGLGAGMNVAVVAQVGLQGVAYTIVGIALAFGISFFLARLFKTPSDTNVLITTGTAICGGSAIAALAPVIRAKPQDVSISLGVVFILNAIALFVFPHIGQMFQLTQEQFGLWAALAIHDTSSVVGASMLYGAKALQVGTTVKLARALWIIPLVLVIAWIRAWHHKADSPPVKAKKPWFILGFILIASLVTFLPELRAYGLWVEKGAKRTMVVALFMIGSNLSLSALKEVGLKALLHAFLLWFLISSLVLSAVVLGVISYSG